MNLKNKFKQLNNPYIILLVGVPLSGKSYFCREFINTIDSNVNIISRDQLVMDVYGSDDYDKSFKNVNQSEVNKQLEKTFRETGKNHENVIIDMTNLSKKRRRFNLSFYDDSYYKMAVVFPFLSDEEYKKRNAHRKEVENKFIPDHVVINMKQSYQTPDRNEGFNRIIWL
jgi:tRNA uridine 5-carbamoylmethylation protein Kti12